MISIKVCGMCDPLNVSLIAEAKPDFMGFIFYRESKRYVGEETARTLLSHIPSDIKRVGVFLDEDINTIASTSIRAGIDTVQLHGNESVAACLELKSAGFTVIKTFSIGKEFSFEYPENYKSACDYFLFDTKSVLHGGSGIKFDWRMLEEYSLDKPFFLSGGIGPGDADSIKSLVNRGLFAVDINSRFEISPGIKDVEKVSDFIKAIKNDQL